MTSAPGWSAPDTARLGALLQRLGVVEGPISLVPVGDGHSNLTAIADDGRRRVVVRRPPPPPNPRGGNDVLREARFLRALAGTEVPVPVVLAALEPGELLDVAVLVMSHVPGAVVTTDVPSAYRTDEERRALGFALVDALVALHAVDPGRAGPRRPRTPTEVNVRSIEMMLRLLEPDVPSAIAELGRQLLVEAPRCDAVTIVHNDFRLGNVIVAAHPPAAVRGVLDWELATVGDPIADLGYLVATAPDADRPETPAHGLGAAMRETGFPTPDQLAGRYSERSGRDIARLQWHAAAADFRLAALFEHARRRALDDFYAPEQVTSFAEAARDRLDRRRDESRHSLV